MKILLDPSYMEFISKERIQGLIKNGDILVAEENVCDMSVFQQNISWTKYLLQKGKLIIEASQSFDELCKKDLFWYSCRIETPASLCFEDAIVNLPNVNGILEIAVLAEKYQKAWLPDSVQPVSLSTDYCEMLFLKPTATRTEIYRAALQHKRIYVYERLNLAYVECIAKKHGCEAVLLDDSRSMKV